MQDQHSGRPASALAVTARAACPPGSRLLPWTDPPGGHLSLRSRSSGLTLTEVVVALAVIAVALIPLMALLPGGSACYLHAERVGLCTLLAQRKMDETTSALMADYNATPSGTGDFSAEGHAGYRYTVSVTQVSGRPLKSLYVLVWEDRDGDGIADSHEYPTTLYTLVAAATSEGG